MSHIEEAIKQLQPLREKLLNHPLYDHIATIDDLKHFTETHVFAVWDFMSLLKGLQQHLTCVSLPWVPSANPKTRRFINEIVLGEESDVNAAGQSMSHYEMYLEAMHEVGADTSVIEKFVAHIAQSYTLSQAFDTITIHPAIQQFVHFTFEVLATKKPHVIAAVFTFGREDLIPDLFIALVKGLAKDKEQKLDKLVYYLERHIELDGDEHGPLSLAMVKELCQDDALKWEEVTKFSLLALQKRIELWDGIYSTIIQAKSMLV
ncbi:DUF3050 domain-containing protein [Aquimarina sp. W85]|uniref:DUF3050 domain-containing protein n=1 Tax=Aquimarina rhodophyticola TaxID=3342246 RepID=UPI00366A87F2